MKMSKGLEMLSVIKFGIEHYCPRQMGREFDVIENELKEWEKINRIIEICKKANEQKYVYIKEGNRIYKENFLDDLDYEVLHNRLYVNSRGIYYSFDLNDYGTEWALTKEELE